MHILNLGIIHIDHNSIYCSVKTFHSKDKIKPPKMYYWDKLSFCSEYFYKSLGNIYKTKIKMVVSKHLTHFCYPNRLVLHQHLNLHVAYPGIPPKNSKHSLASSMRLS